MEKYGFVYLWFDKAYRRFYVGCHWGSIDDGYICSSPWMLKAHKKRPHDFRRRILVAGIPSRQETFDEEYRFLQKIKPEEVKIRYYNLHLGAKAHWSATPNAETIAQKSGDTRRGRSLPATPGRGAKISAAKKGKALTESHKAALREARVGMKLSSAHRASISEGVKKTRTPEMIEQIASKNRGKRRKINYCLTCGNETHSLRAAYCKDHRYDAMNKTRSSKVGSKWHTH